MNKNDFVSVKQAKVLKELGFNKETEYGYLKEGGKYTLEEMDALTFEKALYCGCDLLPAPTMIMAWKWWRELADTNKKKIKRPNNKVKGWRIKTIETDIPNRKIKWDLYSRANVLGGANGSGKTKLFKKIYNNLIKLKSGKESDGNFQITFEGDGPVPNVIYLDTSPDIPLSKVNELMLQGVKIDSDTTILDLMVLKELNKHKRYYGSLTNKYLMAAINYFVFYIDADVFQNINSIDDDVYETVHSLSTGEKQLLYIILSVLNTINEPTVLLLDIIDSSLHFNWQENLLDGILGMAPNIQIILSTHSPAVIMNGWQSAVKEINDITLSDKTDNE